MKTKADALADYLEDRARNGMDAESARLLRYFAKVHAAAFDMIYARDDVASKAAYSELFDLIKGKQGD
jgi:hypothetical protein